MNGTSPGHAVLNEMQWFTSEKTQLLPNKNWSYLMELTSACIETELMKYGRLQNMVAEWRNKCFQSKSICTHPDSKANDFNTLRNELK